MFVKEIELLQYLTRQQMEQRKAMNPTAVKIAYTSAVGYLRSELAAIYDLDAMLAQEAENRDDTLLWIMLVLTSYNLMGAAVNVSPMLGNEYETVITRISTLKAGFAAIPDAPAAAEPNARIAIANNARKMRG